MSFDYLPTYYDSLSGSPGDEVGGVGRKNGGRGIKSLILSPGYQPKRPTTGECRVFNAEGNLMRIDKFPGYVETKWTARDYRIGKNGNVEPSS